MHKTRCQVGAECKLREDGSAARDERSSIADVIILLDLRVRKKIKKGNLHLKEGGPPSDPRFTTPSEGELKYFPGGLIHQLGKGGRCGKSSTVV